MEIVVKCLTTLQHLFLWLPLSSHVPPSLVTTVFYWGSIATQSQVNPFINFSKILTIKKLILETEIEFLHLKFTEAMGTTSTSQLVVLTTRLPEGGENWKSF